MTREERYRETGEKYPNCIVERSKSIVFAPLDSNLFCHQSHIQLDLSLNHNWATLEEDSHLSEESKKLSLDLIWPSKLWSSLDLVLLTLKHKLPLSHQNRTSTRLSIKTMGSTKDMNETDIVDRRESDQEEAVPVEEGMAEKEDTVEQEKHSYKREVEEIEIDAEESLRGLRQREWMQSGDYERRFFE